MKVIITDPCYLKSTENLQELLESPNGQEKMLMLEVNEDFGLTSKIELRFNPVVNLYEIAINSFDSSDEDAIFLGNIYCDSHLFCIIEESKIKSVGQDTFNALVQRTLDTDESLINFNGILYCAKCPQNVPMLSILGKCDLNLLKNNCETSEKKYIYSRLLIRPESSEIEE